MTCRTHTQAVKLFEEFFKTRLVLLQGHAGVDGGCRGVLRIGPLDLVQCESCHRTLTCSLEGKDRTIRADCHAGPVAGNPPAIDDLTTRRFSIVGKG